MKHGGFNSTRQVVEKPRHPAKNLWHLHHQGYGKNAEQNPWKMSKSCLHLRSWFQTSAWRTVAKQAVVIPWPFVRFIMVLKLSYFTCCWLHSKNTPWHPFAIKKKLPHSPMAVDGSNEEVYGCTPGSCEGFITVLFDGRNPAPDM